MFIEFDGGHFEKWPIGLKYGSNVFIIIFFRFLVLENIYFDTKIMILHEVIVEI